VIHADPGGRTAYPASVSRGRRWWQNDQAEVMGLTGTAALKEPLTVPGPEPGGPMVPIMPVRIIGLAPR
jgi:hypothetical protein